MVPQYQYKPLEEPDGIRLIELRPSHNFTSDLHISIVHTALRSCDTRDIFGNYIALSYVWGCPDRIKTIYADSLSLKIIASLFSALVDLRDKALKLMVWADGICINQHDLQEKARQIRIMDQIYTGALHTVIRLRPAETEVSLIWKTKDSHGLATSAEYPPLDLILRNEWFTRVWMFQEFVLSKSLWVQWGRTRVKWTELDAKLTQRMAISQKSGRYPQDDLESRMCALVHQMQEAWNAHHRSDRKLSHKEAMSDNTMLDLLKARRSLGASDPRDMIFALINVASDGGHEDMTIDYTKTCAHIYTRFARYIVKSYGLFDLSSCVRDVELTGTLKDLPSWVPDWRNPGQHSRLPGDYSSRPWFVTDSQKSLRLLWMRNMSIIAFKSRVNDSIAPMSKELSIPQTPNPISQKLDSMEWENYVSYTPGRYKFKFRELQIINENRDAAYDAWKSYIQNEKVLPSNPFRSGIAHFQNDSSSRSKFNCFHSPKFPIDWLALVLLFSFHSKVGDMFVKGKALARLDSGKLAFVPASSKKEDLLVTLKDENYNQRQYIFRRLSPDEEQAIILDDEFLDSLDATAPSSDDTGWPIIHCRFIGHCFCDGHWLTPSSDPEYQSPPYIF